MSKCPAVILHSILAVIIVLVAAFASHKVGADEADLAFCADVALLGEAVMTRRVSGSTFGEVLEEVQSVEDGALAPLAFVVLEAWNSPLDDFTATTPKGIAAEFGSYVRLDCTHNWGSRTSM